jgi:hypothetical protein
MGLRMGDEAWRRTLRALLWFLDGLGDFILMSKIQFWSMIISFQRKQGRE